MTVFSTSSKGTQEKWLKDDYFYKREFFLVGRLKLSF